MRDLQQYELNRLDNGSKVGTGAKAGFCFYDNVNYRSLPDHPASPVYTSSNSCSGGASALTTAMGLSIGWGDIYNWNLAYQCIDITGLTAGRYQLNVNINPGLGLQQTNAANDSTWVKIQLKSKTGASFSILEYGPSA
jgi:hypothetical protein